MRSRFRYASWIFSLLLLMGLSACQRESGVSQTEEGRLVLGAVEQTETLDRSVDLGQRTLALDGFRGTIWLEGVEDTALAHLTFTKRGRGEDESAARNALGRVTLEEAGDAETYRYMMQSRAPSRTAVDVRGTVPRGAAVRIEWVGGTIALSHVEGPIHVQSQGSTVRVAGAGATVDVETRNGAVDVAMARVPDESRVQLRTANGDLTLTLPASTAASVEARTDAGEINTDGLSFTRRRLSPIEAGARFEAQLGTAGAHIDLRTENGTIQLREGRILRLPEEAPVDSVRTTVPPAADTLRADTTRVDTTLAPRPDTTLAPRPDTTARTAPPDTTSESSPAPQQRAQGI